MKLTVQKSDILAAAQRVQEIVATRTPMSILSNVLLETLDNTLVLTATDLQVGLRWKTPARVTEPGASTIPAKTFFAILRELPEGDIEIAIDEKDVATITCGESFFKILGIQKDEFPKMPEFLESESFSMGQVQLRTMLQKTTYAVSREDSRYALMGMYFIIKDKKITLVATDGRRLSRVFADLEVEPKYKKDFIVPLKAIEELHKMLHDEGEVKIFLAKGQVAFQFEEALLISRLIDGTFPDYDRIIPEVAQDKIAIDRKEFLSLVRRAALLTTDQTNMVKLSFGKAKLVVTSNTPELGEARVSMPVKYQGKGIEIAFNPTYLKDVASNMQDDELTFELNDSMSPGVIRGDGNFLHVIMPMRLTEME